MKINNTFNSRNVVSHPAGTQPSQEGSRVPAADGHAPASPQEQRLQAQQATCGRADFDAARVERIRQDIREGRYQINAEKIADGLLATVREMLGKKES